jgi:hypothetical protein
MELIKAREIRLVRKDDLAVAVLGFDLGGISRASGTTAQDALHRLRARFA